MKKILAGIFLVLFIFVTFLIFTLKSSPTSMRLLSKKQETPAFTDWKEFTDPDQRFKVLLPFTPHYTKQAVEIPKSDHKRRYEMFISEQMNGINYMIGIMTYPEKFDTSDREELLKEIVHELMASKPGNQMKEMKPATFHQHEALQFHFINGSFDVQGVAFVTNKSVYMLSYIAELRNMNEAEYNKFMDSFELL